MMKTRGDHLEQFISEQIIGPGVSGYRFVSLKDERLLATKINDQRPIDYYDELINIVPAGVYSTGILFPVDDSKLQEDDGLTNLYEKENANQDANDDDAGNIASKENDENSVEEDDSIRIDQMFPNTMGFTSCFSDE